MAAVPQLAERCLEVFDVDGLSFGYTISHGEHLVIVHESAHGLRRAAGCPSPICFQVARQARLPDRRAPLRSDAGPDAIRRERSGRPPFPTSATADALCPTRRERRLLFAAPPPPRRRPPTHGAWASWSFPATTPRPD